MLSSLTFTMLPPLLSFITLLITVSYASAFSNPGEIAVHLQNRAPSYGGVALAASPCPQGLGTCTGGTGKCCPSQYPFCQIFGGDQGTACCPDSNNCVPAVKAAPSCADDSWSLWQSRNGGYFCCQANQIGILPQGQAVVGNCVASNVPVSATQLATRVNPSSTSIPGSSSTTATSSTSATGISTQTTLTATTTSSTSATGISTQTTLTATTTSRSSASTGNVIRVQDIFSGIAGALCSIFLRFLF